MSKDREKRAKEFTNIGLSLAQAGNELERLLFNAMGIDPETPLEEARKQYKDRLKNIGQFYLEVITKAEGEYNTTLESIKAYLSSRGLALPKDFKTFLNWYIIRYNETVDEFGFSCIEQEHINEYSQELTAKLDYKPLFKYQTQLMQNPDKMYYLTPPHDAERTKEIKQLILHIHNRVNDEAKGRLTYHFDIHKFLTIQGVTADLKAEILAEVRNTLMFFPIDKRADIEQIRAIINDYQPTQPTPHKAESITHPQIALKPIKEKRIQQPRIALYCIYSGIDINIDNCKDIAEKYGYTDPNSGKSLLDEFNKYQFTQNRINNPEKKRSVTTLIKHIENVLPMLTSENKERALYELQTLTDKREKWKYNE